MNMKLYIKLCPLAILLSMIPHLLADESPEDSGKIKTLTPEAAEALAKRKSGVLMLNDLTTLTPEVAEGLAKFKAWMGLNGLTTLTPEAAEALAKHKFWLELNGLTTLTPATARALAKYQGGVLELEGLSTLTPEAAAALVKYDGIVWLDGMTTLTPKAQKVLQANPGMKLPEKFASKGGNKAFELYTARDKQCNYCHGLDGNATNNPSFPKLAGQNAEYLLGQMNDFHGYKRKNGASVGMSLILFSYDESERKQLADWIAGFEKPAVKLDDGLGKNLYQAKDCVSCHGLDANTPTKPLYPRLAGQHSKYHYEQMKAIKDGSRSNGQSAICKSRMMKVSEEEMKVLADWFEGDDQPND